MAATWTQCLVCLVALGADRASAAETVMTTQQWANTDAAFAAFEQRIDETHGRNLLARRGVRIDRCEGISPSSARMLVDGMGGVRGYDGRVAAGGQPSIIAFYLGRPKPIKEVCVFTFNIDTRANQDYEVRFANNSAQPGKLPSFPEKPHLTTGPKVIGANRGGFLSRFRRADGSGLVPGNVDWVEFRIWRTYNVRAGTPAKAKNTAASWSALIELQVLGDEQDVIALSPEERARREAFRRAPKKPRYEKKATWQETMVAAREAIVEWECLQDRLAAGGRDATFGPWHVLGPVAKTDKAIEAARKIDLTKSLPDGLRWQEQPAVKDGELIDLAKLLKAKPGEVAYLCRTVEIAREFDRRNPYAVSVGLRDGVARLLRTRHRLRASRDAATPFPNQHIWQWQVRSGTYQVLVQTICPQDGPWRLWFLPMSPSARPGGGGLASRQRRRDSLFGRLRRDFPNPASQIQMKWEELDSIWTRFRRLSMSRAERYLTDWPKGDPSFLMGQYSARIRERAESLRQRLAGTGGHETVAAWMERIELQAAKQDLAGCRRAYYALATIEEALDEVHRAESMRLAVEDQREAFGSRYRKGAAYVARVEELRQRGQALLDKVMGAGGDAIKSVLKLRQDVDRAGQEILLANPLLEFDKLLVATGGHRFASNWGCSNRLGRQIAVLSPVRPDGKLKTIHSGPVGNMELSWDAKRILFSDGRSIMEINADGTGLRTISPPNREVFHYDPCYLPNGRIVFVSTACEQAVPCTGQAHVGNLHLMDADGRRERRLTYDQDHNWNPVVMADGRVLYTRWEYNDTPHYFTRLLFQMCPDGTGQMAFYGSNSYWPNAMYWPRPIPGYPSRIVCVVSGHHGVAREGELVVLDAQRGRQETDGVVQRIPGRGRPVEPVIKDGLVSESWPRFAAPWPLADPGTNAGAGKYFLVSCRKDRLSAWGLYLVDVFDNMTPLLMGNHFMPIPLRPRPKPPVIAEKVDLSKRTATVLLVDVYAGNGLVGYPRGSIKALRVSSVHYRFAGNGDTRAASYEGGWDVKKILGTVPVYDDGSALFEVPANTPIVVQPLDAEGKAQQQMRSWFSAMPGERISCVGCHESVNTSTQYTSARAMRHAPSRIRPWHGPARGFSFDREVQPVLDRRCAGCHSGEPLEDGRRSSDLRAKRLHQGFDGHYSPAYMALHPYVRRVGYEADYHMLPPAEFEADTSPLVQLLKKGHHGVQLTREEWDRLYTWIDLNIPYPANWRESHRPPRDDQVARRVKYKKRHAAADDRDEQPAPLPPVAPFEPPLAPPSSEAPTPKVAGWPCDAQEAKRRQKSCGLAARTLDLGADVKMTLVPIPAGHFVMGAGGLFADEQPASVITAPGPFWMGQAEVTNAQYARFDPNHDSGYVDARWKDRFTRGYPVNAPEQPVIRVSWNQAMAFCRWLSEKTGLRCTLPTEAQWEYACRAGAAEAWPFKKDAQRVANIADSTLAGWAWGRVEPGYDDGARFSVAGGRYKPNAWGLADMHGNVAEWCLSTYRPYPYDAADGPGTSGPKVVRGGSWNDTRRFATSASRWRYPAHQPIYNVGFRVVCFPRKPLSTTASLD